MIKLKSTDSYRAKKRSAEDRTAAEWNHVAKATRRRRRMCFAHSFIPNARYSLYIKSPANQIFVIIDNNTKIKLEGQADQIYRLSG